MIHFDIVDVMIEQHERIRRLCAEVDRARGGTRRMLFAELHRKVSRHELGDRTIMHPATRKINPAADAIGVACLLEEGNIERAFAALAATGADHPSFETRFGAVHRAVLSHAAHEEREEFPLLRRYIGTQRLHMMSGELHDLQVMAR